MNNAHLKKRVMATLVSSTVVAGAVAAPSASAESWLDRLIPQTAQSYLETNGYKALPQADLRDYDQRANPNLVDNNINLLKTEWGAGWCVDWGNQNPWDPRNSGYQVRQLTGASGHYGDGLAINEDVRYAAINVTKSMMKDYEAYKKGDWSAGERIEVKSDMLRALLSNNRSTLNDARMKFVYNYGALFQELTGFTATLGSGTYGFGGVYLTPNRTQLNKIKGSIKPTEYVTILVPNNYNVELTKKGNSQYQRIVTVIQPGLDFEGNPPKKPWTGTETVETKTVYSTPPARTTVVTETRPQQTVLTTVPGKPTRVTQTRTLPPVTQTTWETLPPQKTTVKVTEPGRVVTKTTTPPPLTWTTVTTVNGRPSTQTTTVPQPVATTTVTEPGQTREVVTTVTERPKVVTQPGSTTTETTVITPTQTSMTTQPAKTEVVTHTVTPDRTAVSTTTTTVPENYYYEKYYERVREVHEYFYFAGFARGEKSKTIELPGNIKGDWTWEITQGEDIVSVDVTGDRQITITPRDGFEGEGIVEIVITDDEGTQHVFRLKVTNTVNVETSTSVKVNNFFYTIDPTSNNTVKIIEKNPGETFEWVFVDQNGNRYKPESGKIEVKDDNGRVRVEVKDPELRGNVVVRVTDKDDNVRENIVTVEHSKTVFNYQQEILNTSTAVVERRGGSYTVTEGEDLVDIEITGDNYRITPKPGSTGKVTIVFTDADGNKYNYTLTIRPDEAEAIKRESDIAFEQTVEILYQENWRYELRGADGLAEVNPGKDDNGKNVWVVKPKDPNGGTVYVDIFDGEHKIGEWTVNIAPKRDIDTVDVDARERKVTDRAVVDIYRGFEGWENLPGNKLEIKEGEDLLDLERSEMPDDGNWKLVFKPGAKGTIRVVESQHFMEDTNEIGADGKPKQKPVAKPVTEFTYVVTPSEAVEKTYNITADNELTLYGTKLKIVQGRELLAGDPQDGKGELRLDIKRDAEGKLVIENQAESGHVIERYVINISKGREATIVPSTSQLTWNGTARIPAAQDDEWKVKEGSNLVELKRDGEFLRITPVGQGEGTVVIEMSDKRGKWGEYHINVVAPQNAVRVYDYTISTNAAFRATLAQAGNRFQLTEGAENFDAPKQENGEWILRPKQDAAGKKGVVVEYDKNGREINRYNLTITQGFTAKAREQRLAVRVSDKVDFPYAKNGGDFTIVSGGEFVDGVHTTDKNGLKVYRVTPKEGSVGQTVRLEERNDQGEVIRVAYVSIVADDAISAEGETIQTNSNLPGAKIENNTTNGSVTINFPKGVADIAITDGADKIERIEDIDGGGVRIIPKDGLNTEEIIKYILLTEKGAQAWDEGAVKVNVKTTVKDGRKGSSEDEKCLAAVLPTVLTPLLLGIPVGLLAQVQIPGLEEVSAQVNGAIRQANDYLQRGLGVYDRERAAAAAGIQGKLAAVNPEFIGLAAGSFVLISVGLLAADAIMRACGAGAYTSSYQIGKALDSEALMKGSSGEIPEEKQAPAKKESQSKTETKITVKDGEKVISESTTTSEN